MYQNKHRSTSARTELARSGRYRPDFKNGSDLQHLWGYFISGDNVLCSHLGEKHHLPTHNASSTTSHPEAGSPQLRAVPLPVACPHLSVMVPSFPSQVPLLQHGLPPSAPPPVLNIHLPCCGIAVGICSAMEHLLLWSWCSLSCLISFLFLSFSSIFCPLPSMFPQKHLQHCWQAQLCPAFQNHPETAVVGLGQLWPLLTEAPLPAPIPRQPVHPPTEQLRLSASLSISSHLNYKYQHCQSIQDSQDTS